MAEQQKSGPVARFDFLGPSKVLTGLSILLVIVSLGLIFGRGLNYGVDFSGGIEVQVQFSKAMEAERVRKFTTDLGFPEASVQAYGADNEYLIRLESIKGKDDKESNELLQATIAKIKEGLGAQFASEGATVRRFDTVGPQVGAQLRKNGILAGFYCLLLILIYVGLRFDYRFSPGAVFCIFHDAILTLGIFALFDWEVTTQTMAAILTIMGYSLNDTIVIFDRIRENMHIHRGRTIYWISNLSINETLSRTILTFVTTSFTVVAMYIFADGVIKDFALALIIGMVLGVYSTVYVATPLMLVADHFQKNRKQRAAA